MVAHDEVMRARDDDVVDQWLPTKAGGEGDCVSEPTRCVVRVRSCMRSCMRKGSLDVRMLGFGMTDVSAVAKKI